MRDHLKTLVRLLQANGESVLTAIVEDVIAGPDAALDAFLSSNELWGGAGSIADRAGGPDRSEGRRRIERLLLQLGKEQIRRGKANQRTEMWVTAFSNWEKAGI